MSAILESPASPVEGHTTGATLFTYTPPEVLESPASPLDVSSPIFQDRSTDRAFVGSARTSFRAISPPTPKRPRLDPPLQDRHHHPSDAAVKFRLPTAEHATEPRRKTPFTLGSSSSPPRRASHSGGFPAPLRRPGYDPTHRSSSQSLLKDSFRSGEPSKSVPVPNQNDLAIPTAPKAMLNYQAKQRAEQMRTVPDASHQLPARPRTLTPPSVLKERPAIGSWDDARSSFSFPVFEEPPFSHAAAVLGDSLRSLAALHSEERASSNGAATPSDISSVAPPRENCINCRFPLAQNATLVCKSCHRHFHEQCKKDSRLFEGLWTCVKCLKRETKKLSTQNAAMTSSSHNSPRGNNLAVPQSSGRHSISTANGPLSSTSQSRSPVQALENYHTPIPDPSNPNLVRPPLENPKYHSTNAHRPAQATPSTAQVRQPFSLPAKPVFLRDAGIKPSGNAFARGIHFRSWGDTPSSEQQLKAITSVSSRPASRGSETEASMDLSDDVADLNESEVITSTPWPQPKMVDVMDKWKAGGEAGGVVPVDRQEMQGSLTGEQVQDLALAPLQPLQQKPMEEAINEQEQRKSERKSPSAPVQSIPDLTSPTAESSPHKERKLPPGMKLKKKTTSGLDEEKQKTQVKPKPSGVIGWARQFELAGCEDPFQEGGSRSEKLNHCEELYQLFGKCPWDLVAGILRPKRFKIRLLRALANLKTVLDRFDEAGQCLVELEKFVGARQARDKSANITLTRMTSGDVEAFIAMIAARPVNNVQSEDGGKEGEGITPEKPETELADTRDTISGRHDKPATTTKPVSRRPAAARKTVVPIPPSSVAEDQVSEDDDDSPGVSAVEGMRGAEIREPVGEVGGDDNLLGTENRVSGLSEWVETRFAELLRGDDGQRTIAPSEVVAYLQKAIAQWASFEGDPGQLEAESRELFRGVRAFSQGNSPDERSAWLNKAVIWSLGHIRSNDSATNSGPPLRNPEIQEINGDARVEIARNTTSQEQPSNLLLVDEGFEGSADSTREQRRRLHHSEATLEVLTGVQDSIHVDERSVVNDVQTPIHEDDGAIKTLQLQSMEGESSFDAQSDTISETESNKKATAHDKSLLNKITTESFQKPRAAVSGDQNLHPENGKEGSELTNLGNTPEPPSQLFAARTAAELPKRDALKNAAKLNEDDSQSSLVSGLGKKQGKASRLVTNFTLRELLLLALYIEPIRVHGDNVELPRMTSKAIVEFVQSLFPQFGYLENQSQNENLYNSLAAQCSTHVSRGVLAKSMQTDPGNEKVYTVYYADTSSRKFLAPSDLALLQAKWLEHLAEHFPEMLENNTGSLPRKRPREGLDTPPAKKQKREEMPTPRSPWKSHKSAKSQTGVRAARKNNAPATRSTPMHLDDQPMTTRMLLSASRMKASNPPEISRRNRRRLFGSSPGVADSTMEEESSSPPRAFPVREPDMDVPRAFSPDPLDDLLLTSKVANADEQDLLDLLPVLCAQEAANDAARMAQKNYEVKDFYAHWPERHPRHIMFDSVGKMKEIRRRLNRRQMLGLPYRRADAIKVYHPYRDLIEPSFPTFDAMSFESIPPRMASPKKKDSPRKRRGMRDDSNIYAADIDVIALETTAMESERKVDSWQEALGLPKELVPGFVTDFSSKKGKRLVMEVPLSVRGKSRNWFKALIPEE